MMSAQFHNDRNDRRAGFSLLELIGVMAVASILLAAAIPLTVNVIQSQRLADEKAALPALAEALKRGMLREQAFPLYANNVSRSQEVANDYYWWNLAARHGAGSANEARYPVGSRNTAGNVRKLYFADGSFADFSFPDLTGNGSGWLNDFQDPRELRLLLLSTTNPDLPLPDTISGTEFDNLWDNWAVGSDGEPMSGNWAAYGLSASQWENRAAELVLQRVDLREWLCEVTVEIRRGVDVSGLGVMPFSLADVEDTTDMRRVVLENVSGVQVHVARSTDQSGSGDVTYTIESIVIDGIPIVEMEYDTDDGVFEELTPQIILLNDSGGQVDNQVLNLEDRNSTLGFGNSDSAIQTRYFLLNEIINLLDTGKPTPNQVGAVVLDENFKTIRFDGQRWRY